MKLTLRSMNDFWEEGVSENVCRLKFEHYERKRRAKHRQIQEFLSNIKS